MPTITLEPYGPPIVRILGATLRRAAEQPKLARRMDKLRGKLAMKSTTDPQSATISFRNGTVHVAHGVDPAAGVVISADLNTMGRPGAPKPKVKGALRHLGFALGVAKVLDPPSPGGWQGAVDRFWHWAEDKPTRPDQLRVVCTDDGTEHTVGQTGTRCAEIHGPAWVLQAVFTGGDHLGAAMFEGRLQAVGSLPVISELVGLGGSMMLGER